MAYAAAITFPPVDPRLYQVDTCGKTIVCESRMRGFSRDVLYDALKTGVEGFNTEAVLAMWKTEKPGCWYVTLRNAVQVNLLLTAGCVRAGQDYVYFSAYNRQLVTLRVHWMHHTIDDQFCRLFFGRYGKVVSITHEKISMVDGVQVETGLRIIKLELSTVGKSTLPHIVKIGDMAVLIVAPGRMPVCIKCFKLGHVKADCPYVRRNNIQQTRNYEQNRSYEQQQQQQQQQHFEHFELISEDGENERVNEREEENATVSGEVIVPETATVENVENVENVVVNGENEGEIVGENDGEIVGENDGEEGEIVESAELLDPAFSEMVTEVVSEWKIVERKGREREKGERERERKRRKNGKSSSQPPSSSRSGRDRGRSRAPTRCEHRQENSSRPRGSRSPVSGHRGSPGTIPSSAPS